MIHHGDLFDVLPMLEADSIDACVTDPPYELKFMGKHWDGSGVAFQQVTWAEVYRVLKPGAHLLAFGGTRTFHRMTCAIEDAGFEIRDCLSWLYGQGFPKSLDVSKAFDVAAGAKREIVGRYQSPEGTTGMATKADGYGFGLGDMEKRLITAPSTDLAKQWQGWGTALKPSWEPIILARKPLTGTVAANVAQYGTGALNIDACRIDGEPWTAHHATGLASEKFFTRGSAPVVYKEPHDQGRWPANALLDDEAAALLDEQTGELVDGVAIQRNGGGQRIGSDRTYSGFGAGLVRPDVGYGGRGGASRFYYVAKPSREERDYGCDVLPARSGGEATDRKDGSAGVNSPRAGAGRTGGSRNVHPTVKPVELMRWLVRLVTPPGGLVLDPFTGSGTTGMACRYEQRRFIGIEREAEYVAIAERRIGAVAPLFGEASA